MQVEDLETRWQAMSLSATSGMRAWREAHLKATLSEIEKALDERLERVSNWI
jgi:hypothetical protein